MAPFRRNIRRKPFRAKGRKSFQKRTMKRTTLRNVARRLNTLSRTIETKSSVQTYGDGFELNHNRIYISSMLSTVNGTLDLEIDIGQRIGDKITLTSVQVKGMIELNERYSDVGVKVMVVKSAKGDNPTDANLLQGVSAN